MLIAWFYDPTSDSHGWLNKLIAYMDAPFCHVELQFPDSTAYTVYMGSEVIKKERSFNNACYTACPIHCTPAQSQAARRVADRLYTERHECSALDMTSCIFGVPMCPSKTFCSKLVGQILCESGIIPDSVDFRTLSPSKLHSFLTTLGPVSVPCHARLTQSRPLSRLPRPEPHRASEQRAAGPIMAIDFRDRADAVSCF